MKLAEEPGDQLGDQLGDQVGNQGLGENWDKLSAFCLNVILKCFATGINLFLAKIKKSHAFSFNIWFCLVQTASV